MSESRAEQALNAIIDELGSDNLPAPLSRIECLLHEVADQIKATAGATDEEIGELTLRVETVETKSPGISVDDTEPTDPDVKVWVNPNGTKYVLAARDIVTDIPGETVEDRLSAHASQLDAITNTLTVENEIWEVA